MTLQLSKYLLNHVLTINIRFSVDLRAAFVDCTSPFTCTFALINAETLVRIVYVFACFWIKS